MKSYQEYVLENNVEFLKNFHKENPCSKICQFKEKKLWPKLFNFGTKIRGKHMLTDLYIDLQARDKLTGKVTRCHHQHAQSWVNAFARIQFANMIPLNADKPVTDIFDVSHNLNINDMEVSNVQAGMFSVWSRFADNVATNNTNVGIVIGSGSMAVDISDNKLQSKLTSSITHGVMVEDEGLNNPDSQTRQFKFTRTFTNATGLTIIIREVGLHGNTNYSGTSDVEHLLERTVLGSPFTVLDTEIAILGYTIKMLAAPP